MANEPGRAGLLTIAKQLPPSEKLLFTKIIATAAPWADRGRADWCRPRGNARLAGHRVQLIVAAFGLPVPQLKLALKRRGIEWESFCLCLDDVEVTDLSKSPGWVGALSALLFESSGGRGGTPATHGQVETVRALLGHTHAAVAEAAMRRLPDITSGHESDFTVEPAVMVALATDLADRVTGTLAQSLAFRHQLMSCLGNPTHDRALLNSSADWLAFFELFPVAAYLVGTACLHWEQTTAMLLHRARSDMGLLARTFFGGRRPHALTGVTLGLGDPHNHGASVAELTFDDTQRVMYKPRDLRATAAVRALAGVLSVQLARSPLRVPLTIPRGENYAWEEFVSPAPAQSLADIEGYYFNFGENLRFLELIEARDQWLDNVLASKASAVFFDFETVLQPRHSLPGGLSSARAACWAALQESAVVTGAITAKVPLGPGLPAEDFGALAPRRARKMPLTVGPDLAQAYMPDGKAGFLFMEPPHYSPSYKGRDYECTAYIDNLLDGYDAADSAVAARRLELMHVLSEQRIDELPVRYIQRDTWSYWRLLQASCNPVALSDGITRDARIIELLRQDGENIHPDIIFQEYLSIQRLDIPMFLAHPGSRHLFTESGRVDDVFEGTALSRLERRLSNSSGVGSGRDLIRSGIAVGDRSPWFRGAKAVHYDLPGPPDLADQEFFLKKAIQLGDLLSSKAFPGSDGSLAWPGVFYNSRRLSRELIVLPPDVLTGTCGVAMFLARLFAATQIERFRDAAQGALFDSVQLAKGWHRRHDAMAAESGLAALASPGGVLYSLHYCGHALNNQHLAHLAQDAARFLLDGAALDSMNNEEFSNSRYGTLAAATSVLNSAEATGEDVAWLRTLSNRAMQYLPESQHESARESEPLLGAMPGPQAAQKLLSFRLGANVRPTDTSQLRKMQVGDLLVEAAVAGSSATTPANRAALLDVITEKCARRYSRTYQILDARELASAAYLLTGDSKFAKERWRLAQLLCHRRRESGYWMADELAADHHNVSAVHGASAIGLALIEEASGRALMSMRLFPPLAAPLSGACSRVS